MERARWDSRPFRRYLADEGLSCDGPKKSNRMAETKRQELPVFVAGGKHKGPLISLVTRLIIVAVVTLFISVVTAILLIREGGATRNVVPVMVFAIIIPATLAVIINYLYWRPRYRGSEISKVIE